MIEVALVESISTSEVWTKTKNTMKTKIFPSLVL